MGVHSNGNAQDAVGLLEMDGPPPFPWGIRHSEDPKGWNFIVGSLGLPTG